MPNWLPSLKFRLLSLFFSTLFCVIYLSHSMAAISAPPPSEIRGVWLTTHDTQTVIDHDKLQTAITQLAALNFNTLYPVVWNSGYALYPSPVAQQAGIQPFIRRGLQGQDPLADLITQAHQHELLVLPWFEFGFMTPPTSELALKHPNWLTQQSNGSLTSNSAAGEVVWLNPFHPEVQKFIISLVTEVMQNYNVDGIQFDDHLSLPVEFGYDAYTRNLYRQQTGREPPSNPYNETWRRWRADQLTAFVKKLHQALKKQKPNAIFSVSPNPYETAYKSHLQDWLSWVRQGIVDELIVQVYRPDLSVFVEQITRPEIRETQGKIPTGIGILSGVRHQPVAMKFIQEKVLASRQRGLGVSFFFYSSLWEQAPEPPNERQLAFQSLFSNPAHRSLKSTKNMK
jgi:uncharacterized lipoprotein YddW (UPF0748 family)